MVVGFALSTHEHFLGRGVIICTTRIITIISIISIICPERPICPRRPICPKLPLLPLLPLLPICPERPILPICPISPTWPLPPLLLIFVPLLLLAKLPPLPSSLKPVTISISVMILTTSPAFPLPFLPYQYCPYL